MRTSIRRRLLTLTLLPVAALLVGALSLLVAGPGAAPVVAAAMVAAALASAAVVVVSLGRGVADPLARLTTVAGAIAESLPARVAAVVRGDGLTGDDVQELPADLLERADELGDLARALAAATAQAGDLAVEQARTRHGVAQTISDVARREQSMVERQLSLLEVMESREEDPDQLAQLFALDHLATRMRRNAENLLLLSAGQMPGVGETEPLALVDVIRSAAAETEDYARVDVRVGLPLDVVGYAATPLSHLLAELIENATTFSPPQSRVTVTTHREGEGVLVTVSDRGLGIPPADLEDARRRLSAPPLLEAAESRRLGLYVVGLLAQRMGVTVDLRAGEPGGLDVVVGLPAALFTTPPASLEGPSGLAASLAATPPDPGRPAGVPSLESSTPDAVSFMHGLLDATPSAPPDLPADVQAIDGPLLPHRADAPAEAPADDGGGLSLARASGGHTVELDPSQVSQLMRSFSADLDFGGPPDPVGPSAAAPQVAPPSAAPPTPVASPAPAPTPTAAASRRATATSAWSTPFPTKGDSR